MIISITKNRLINVSIRSYKFVNRGFCEKSSDIPVVSYEVVKEIIKNTKNLVVDVRETHELAETGQIPTSINVPLDSVQGSFQLPAEQFIKKFDRDLPKKTDEIVFYCLSGKRSTIASETVSNLGFRNVKNYRGSWMDWAEHEGLPVPKKK